MEVKQASYEFVSNPIGPDYVRTTLKWKTKPYGDYPPKDQEKTGTIKIRHRFVSWCRKYGLTPTQEEIDRLPKNL